MTTGPHPFTLDKATLHPSLRDPLLDVMNFLNEIVDRFPHAISFAPGRPHEGLFTPGDTERLITRYRQYLRDERGLSEEQITTTLLQYGPTSGIIRELLVRTLHNDEGIHARPDDVVITVGFQEALFTTLRALFADPDDVLLVPEPCYTGVTGAAAVLGIPLQPVPEGPNGLDADAVARAADAAREAGKRPRACYVVPDFANPSGHTLTLTDRHRLLAAAHHNDLLLLEDNPYGFFTRDGHRHPTLHSLDTRGHVIYLGSFAKSCFPGARVGYVVAGQPVHDPATGTSTPLAAELAKIKSMITVNTPAVSQAVIGGMLVEHDCSLATANDPAARFYRRNMDVLLDALATALPDAAERGVRWNNPGGGFFACLEVPFTADEALLEISAERFGVIWTPMSSFHTGPGGRNALRLSISYLDPHQIRDGVRRLARLITWRLAHPTPTPTPTPKEAAQ